jgi:hypothetical protein
VGLNLFLAWARGQNPVMFNIGNRDRVRDRVLNLASTDPRVVAGAAIGSLAHDQGDRWSDLDFMFAVADDIPVVEVLEAWTETLLREFRAVQLFDLPSGPILYRVFLVPDCLELDLSFTHASEFRGSGVKFRLLFGEVVEQPEEPPTPAHELFGYAVHHTLFMHGSRSSEVDIGRLSIGLARYATRHSPSLVGAAGSTAGMAGTSTGYPPTSWIPSTKHSCGHWGVTNSIVPLERRLRHLFVNRLRPGKWSRTLKANCANWRRDQVANCSSNRPN